MRQACPPQTPHELERQGGVVGRRIVHVNEPALAHSAVWSASMVGVVKMLEDGPEHALCHCERPLDKFIVDQALSIEERDDHDLVGGDCAAGLLQMGLCFAHPLPGLLLQFWVVHINPTLIKSDDMTENSWGVAVEPAEEITHVQVLLFLGIGNVIRHKLRTPFHQLEIHFENSLDGCCSNSTALRHDSNRGTPILSHHVFNFADIGPAASSMWVFGSGLVHNPGLTSLEFPDPMVHSGITQWSLIHRVQGGPNLSEVPAKGNTETDVNPLL